MPDLKSYFIRNKIEAGLDEAGRGCLAGPVVAAAVILPQSFFHPKLNDSKLLSEKNRIELEIIIKSEAISYAIGIINNLEIDRINILKASFKAMNMAVGLLQTIPEMLLVDGNRFIPEYDIPYKCFVKGDSRFSSIAAASVLAKTFRDRYMMSLDKEFPQYNWKKNKGYPTQEHRKALQMHGVSSHHRLSFRLMNSEEQLRLF